MLTGRAYALVRAWYAARPSGSAQLRVAYSVYNKLGKGHSFIQQWLAGCVAACRHRQAPTPRATHAWHRGARQLRHPAWAPAKQLKLNIHHRQQRAGVDACPQPKATHTCMAEGVVNSDTRSWTTSSGHDVQLRYWHIPGIPLPKLGLPKLSEC
eukprot:1161125-Pelagomonas_calceolata.AAC.16